MDTHGLDSQTVERLRGQFFKVVFKPELCLSSVVGRLYNVDPTTGTIFLFDLQGHARNEDETPFRVILQHAVESFAGNFTPLLCVGLANWSLAEDATPTSAAAAARAIEVIDEKLQLRVTDILQL